MIAVSSIVLIAVIGGFAYARWTEMSVSNDNGLAAAEACSTLFSAVYPNASEFSPEDEDYNDFRSSMRDLCIEFGMTYMYVFHDDADKQIGSTRGYGVVVHEDLSDVARRALNGEEVQEPFVLDNEFGRMMTWYSKVEGTDNILAGADFSVSEQEQLVIGTAFAFVIPPILALTILLFVELRVLNRHVFNPIRMISKSMREFSAGRANGFKPLGINSEDEIGEIAESYEVMAHDIASYVDDIGRMTEERVQSEVEVDVARRIQLGMVPLSMGKSSATYDVRARAKPARQVGGDFYDCLEIGDDRIAVVVGDVSGKGIAGALFMAMTKTLIAEQLMRDVAPAAVLNYANERLCKQNPEGMFVTVFIAVLEPATGCTRYANAGHLAPFVVGKDIYRIEPDPGVLLGLFDDADIEEGEFVLQEGESLLLFTDGVTEAVNVEKEFLGDERFEEHLRDHVPYTSAQQLVDDVVEFVGEFATGYEQYDDLTVEALMRTGSICDDGGKESGEVRDAVEDQGDAKGALAVDIAAFAQVRDEILAVAPDSMRGRKACLACEEAFANIVLYSGAEHIWFEVAPCNDMLSMTLIDDGIPFDPTTYETTEKGFDELDTGGMGINLVRDMASELSYHREGNRNVFTIIL